MSRVAVIAISLSLLSAACGNGVDVEPTDTDEQPRVGLILPGPINDRGYNEGNYGGLAAIEQELGWETAFVEEVSEPAQQLDAMRNLAGESDLVIATGGEFADVAKTAAEQFPDVTFVVMDGAADDAPENLYFHVIDWRQHPYVVGAIAAELTATQKIGYIAGLDIPPTIQGNVGFRAGVNDTDPSIEYVDTSIGTFEDPARARDAAEAQFDADVDVMFAFLNAGYAGTLSAAEDSGKDVSVFVGQRSPEVCGESPHALGVAIVDFPGRMLSAARDFEAGELPAFQASGLESGLIEIHLCEGFDTPELNQVIETTTEGIVEGTIEIPEVD